MANPQKENGYTPIANEILEQICKLKLNGTQYKIIIIVWRFTYGFSRKEHELSESFIANATNTHKIQLSKELNKLIECNILNVTREATFTRPRKLAFNKNYSEWIDKQLVNTLTLNEFDDTTVSEITNTTVSEFTNQENNNKTKLKQGSPDLFPLFWDAYPRKVSKVAAKKAFDKLKVDDSLLKQMLKALETQKKSKQWQTKEYVPHPATWLNQRRWEDETEEEQEEILKQTDIGLFKF